MTEHQTFGGINMFRESTMSEARARLGRLGEPSINELHSPPTSGQIVLDAARLKQDCFSFECGSLKGSRKFCGLHLRIWRSEVFVSAALKKFSVIRINAQFNSDDTPAWLRANRYCNQVGY